jgi:hypothetical protein
VTAGNTFTAPTSTLQLISRGKMKISEIKHILGSNEIPDDKINPMINRLEDKDLGSLSLCEREALREVICNLLILMQDPDSGAHLEDPIKAKLLLSAIG